MAGLGRVVPRLWAPRLGGTNLALDAGLDIWDWAPFAPIVEGAGGRVTDWDGRPLRRDSGTRVLAAGDAALHDAARTVVEMSREDRMAVMPRK